MKTIELLYETATRNFYRYGSKTGGYIITVYTPKTPDSTKPKSVKVVIEE